MGVYDFYKIPLCLGLGKLGIRLGEGNRVTSLYKCIDRKHALGKGRRQLGLVCGGDGGRASALFQVYRFAYLREKKKKRMGSVGGRYF